MTGNIFNVAYIKDGIFQTILIKSNHHSGMVYGYVDHIMKADRVLDVKKVRLDDLKPGKPIIEF